MSGFRSSQPPQGPFNLPETSSASRRRNRTNYRCSKCGQPKRGHVCPYQPRVLRADGERPPDMKTVATQVEIDERLVVRHLRLEAQGLPESYGEAASTSPIGNESFDSSVSLNLDSPGSTAPPPPTSAPPEPTEMIIQS